jgi:hypothetical protein
MLKLPLTDALITELGRCVEEVRTKTREVIRKQQNIANDCVRANVFVPDYLQTRDGWAFELFMEPRLRLQMNRPQEYAIRFAPGQGATGKAFLESRQSIVPRRDFELTDALRDNIHPDLKWIITTPIKSSSGAALGVLNIDGLRHELDVDTVLQEPADLIARELRSVEPLLDACSKVIVKVQYGEVQQVG